jgi:hypothetical protein
MIEILERVAETALLCRCIRITPYLLEGPAAARRSADNPTALSGAIHCQAPTTQCCGVLAVDLSCARGRTTQIRSSRLFSRPTPTSTSPGSLSTSRYRLTVRRGSSPRCGDAARRTSLERAPASRRRQAFHRLGAMTSEQERIDHVPGDPAATSWRRAARRHQSAWREDHGYLRSTQSLGKRSRDTPVRKSHRYSKRRRRPQFLEPPKTGSCEARFRGLQL